MAVRLIVLALVALLGFSIVHAHTKPRISAVPVTQVTYCLVCIY